MLTNHILEIKNNTQKLLDEEAEHDLKKYIENSHRIVKDIEKKYGFKFNYIFKEHGYTNVL